jgi:glycosyltransferase involved in cell wall biosynthesis
MRIAFHVPRASHLKLGFSGDKILVRGLLEGLARRGHDVEIVSQMNVRNVWRGRVSRDELVGEISRVRCAMERFAPDAWLVYGASTTNPDLFGWRMASWRATRRPRYVLLATDLGTGKRLPVRWRRLFAWAHRRALARADWISAYHPSSRDDLVRQGIAERQVLLLPPAVCPWKQIPPLPEARRRLGLPQDAPVLFCASRFPDADGRDAGKMRMLFDLIAASTSLPPEAHLVIAGDGPARPLLEQSLASLPNRCNTRLAGPVEHSHMPWYFAACDFFVYPNTVDRPWLAVLEAQACGRPVVTMRTRSAELTLRPGETGLLAADLTEFRQAINALAADRQRARNMGCTASRYVAENHALDVRIDHIERRLEASGGGSPQLGGRFLASQPMVDSPQDPLSVLRSTARLGGRGDGQGPGARGQRSEVRGQKSES